MPSPPAKRWSPYVRFLKTGEWHAHTSYTDGYDTLMDMCRRASRNGLPLIAFTEHVRKEVMYEWPDLKKEALAARNAFPDMKILLGCEAKVLGTDGSLDIQPSLKRECDLLTGVFHSFPSSKKKPLLQAAHSMIKDPLVDVFGHPMTILTLSEEPITRQELLALMEDCKKHYTLVENNTRYPNSPDMDYAIRKSGVLAVRGSDAHRVSEIRS